MGMMKYRRFSHCVFLCDYHIVLTTKYRKKVFNEGIFAYFGEKLQEIRKYYPEIEFQEINHDKDHVHFLISIPPTMSVGKVVGIIKTNTAKGLKQKFPFLKEVYWGTSSVWSSGYFVSTVGINEKIIQNYITKQGEEDSGQAQLELG